LFAIHCFVIGKRPVLIQMPGAKQSAMGERERDTETGEFVDKYPRGEIRQTIQELGGMAATSEVAAELDAPRNTIYKKLRAMDSDGAVTSRMAGGIRVWSVSKESEE
jgi:DNA-binding NtrC family response regulator